MQKKSYKLRFLFFILLLSCTQFVRQTDDSYYESVDAKTDSTHLNLIFSHNINGETHPCGCRNFPLGGLPQVAGKLYDLKQKNPLLYVDTGDTFFPSYKFPDSVKQSLTFTATKLAQALDEIGLKFITPGDQDFALGEEFLAELSQKHKFKFIISNIIPETKIIHKKWAKIKYSQNEIIFIGVVEPSIIPSPHRRLFKDSISSLRNVLKEIKSSEGSLEDKTIILLSHSGFEKDKQLAKEFKEIDLIVGAHSQSFFKDAREQGNTQFVQVLSRNHYLGQVKLFPTVKQKPHYSLIEVRDELVKLWENNPWVPWLNQYKTDLDKVLLKEQEAISGPVYVEQKAPTANSCISCHDKQTEFWKGTAHSLAYITLKKSKAENNTQCIECHSLKYKDPAGFIQTTHIVSIADDKRKNYWKEWNSKVYTDKSIRKMASTKRKTTYNKWVALDEKFEVTHNYANVQCLNCHQRNNDHPFSNTAAPSVTDYAPKCVVCHTSDQSPEWYTDGKMPNAKINKKHFAKMLKKVACPKSE